MMHFVCMKRRRNIVVDDELLETARKVTGEKTYSGTVTKALEEITRQTRFREALREFQELAWTEGVFHPDYIKEKMASSLSREPERVSAHEARAPRRKKRAAR
jgi:Arc/MetJ family transcription regulator